MSIGRDFHLDFVRKGTKVMLEFQQLRHRMGFHSMIYSTFNIYPTFQFSMPPKTGRMIKCIHTRLLLSFILYLAQNKSTVHTQKEYPVLMVVNSEGSPPPLPPRFFSRPPTPPMKTTRTTVPWRHTYTWLPRIIDIRDSEPN